MSEPNVERVVQDARPDESRKWIAPKLTVLNSEDTAGGTVNINTTEAFNYHPS